MSLLIKYTCYRGTLNIVINIQIFKIKLLHMKFIYICMNYIYMFKKCVVWLERCSSVVYEMKCVQTVFICSTGHEHDIKRKFFFKSFMEVDVGWHYYNCCICTILLNLFFFIKKKCLWFYFNAKAQSVRLKETKSHHHHQHHDPPMVFRDVLTWTAFSWLHFCFWLRPMNLSMKLKAPMYHPSRMPIFVGRILRIVKNK